MAQENGATVTGQVLDSSGAGVVGATVTARNVETGFQRVVVTNESANYTLPILPIGSYEITSEKQGFEKLIKTGVVLQVDQHARVDFTLQVGATTNSVQVTADVPLTQTDSSSTGAVIDNRKVVELPLNGRQFYSLALLVPGVAPPAQGSILSFRGGFNVAGASELNNNFTLNGLDNNNQLLSAPAFRPSVDAIEEFKILTGVFPAEYGRNSGSQVIVTTKAGTNGFHGTAFEFLRNQKVDAVNYFTPAGSKPAFRQNQFGGTVGGPIIKNKTFFFASYEGTRSNQQITTLTNVPTPAMVNGDFSGISRAIIDPTNGQPFLGNKIPTNRINPAGQFLAKLYPAPTAATAAGALPANNYTLNEPQIDSLNLGSIRIDHSFSERDVLNASYNDFEDNTLTQNNNVCGSRTIPGFDCTVLLIARLGGLTETHTFSPSLINEFKIAYSQFQNPRSTNDSATNFLQMFNIPGTRADGPARTGVPQVTVNGFATLGEPTNFPQVRTDHTYQLADSVSWNVDKHAFKFGGDFHRFQSNGTIVGNGRGSFIFNAQNTAPTTTYAFADLLLGTPTSAARSPLSPRIYDRTGIYAGFLQDDWKVSSRFTINWGLRYEYNLPTFEKYNTLSNFNPTTGQIDIAGQNGVPNGLWDRNAFDLEPRFGFSWQPFHSSRTVVRGGYGIFYNAPALNAVNSGPQQSNAPFVSAQTFNSNFVTPVTLSNPYPAAAAGAGSLTLSAFNRHQPDARIQQWNMNIQQELTRNLVLEVGYQGSAGTHLPLIYNINQPPPGPGSIGQKQALRPYPQFGNITFLDAVGNSSFNGLLTKLQQRYSNGLSFLLSYMYGKSIDNTPGTPYNVTPSRSSAENPKDLSLERGLSGFDLRHRFVFSPVYELPFGKGKPFLNSNRYVGWLVGGWQASGILSIQSGRPFTALVSQDNANVLSTVDRPNIIGNGNDGPKTVQQWINVSAFQLAPAGTFGNAGRNNLIGPGMTNLDVVLSRNFQIMERYSIQFRAESFNIANHPNFDLPSQTFGVPGFGSIPSAEAPRQIQFGLKVRF
ncbi:MAG TPA: carboxypeptidase regulatory-like domain-containing protein [Bryobacteraceae bacterium]|nr:carboxypeptidase regulatory-like domain-containing protein [Bryobacteraceae bacterium]